MNECWETRVKDEIRRVGPRTAFRNLIAENDALIRGADLDNGRELVSARTAIYTGLVAEWAREQHEGSRYRRPFAVVALGGTGRGEMTPFSDNDFALLFDDALEGNAFLMELQEQVLHSDAFVEEHGFVFQPLPFNLDDATELAEKQLNAFVDMRPVYDPEGLSARFHERIRATFDPFRHFLHVRGFWKGQWEKAASEWERIDRFDIKSDGLRVFLAGIWTLAGKRFDHSHEVYRQLEDPRDLQAYEFLLRIRGFIHSRIKKRSRPLADGAHAEDILTFAEYVSFGEMLGPGVGEEERFAFANEVRARLLAARRRVARFTKTVIEGELLKGREAGPNHPIVYGVGGLRHTRSSDCRTDTEKSRAALALLLASQRYGVAIDTTELQRTFRDAGDWLCPVPELGGLLYEEQGSLADTWEFLAQFDGAEDRLFPGYARFEASVDSRVEEERLWLRGALERQKTRILEKFVKEGRAMLAEAVSSGARSEGGRDVSERLEAARLEADQLAAVKLALKTKRLPLTQDDQELRQRTDVPLMDRLATGMSEIPLERYYDIYRESAEIPEQTLQLVRFLITRRRAFKEFSRDGMNDAAKVEAFAKLCETEAQLRMLFVFTCADRSQWHSERTDPARWFNTRELYGKTLAYFQKSGDPTRYLDTSGYAPDDLRILKDFGVDFFTGIYRQYANRFGSHLLRMAEEPWSNGPKVSVLRDGGSTILGVAARDFRGLAACITGALSEQNVQIRQAHFFSATIYGLVMDFFHIDSGDKAAGSELAAAVEESIRSRRHIDEGDASAVPRLNGETTLQEWRPGQYCLRHETANDARGLVYALCYHVFRHLRGNIFGLVAHATRGSAYISVYLNLPPDLSFPAAKDLVATQFQVIG